MTTIPFLDLSHVNGPIADRVVAGFSRLVDTGTFVNGPQVAEFESAFAAFVGVDHCVGLASGLDALRLGLVAAGVGEGDEVLVPAMTFVATWEAVTQVGATPVPVDVRADDYGLDAAACATAVTSRTTAIVPVHLYGQVADLGATAEVARRHALVMIEDAAQAHGARRGDTVAGRSGLAGAFSFYPAKNLGAMGDAGALVTDDAGVADAVRALREHGQRQKYEHDLVGWTARLDTVQALVLSCRLESLAEQNSLRAQAAAAYSAALAGVGDLVLPSIAPASEPVWHLYVVLTANPGALAEHLRDRGIGTGRHYPVPPHLTAAYAGLGHAQGSFPVAESIADRCLSLPLFPGITEGQIEAVVSAVRSWFDG